MLIVSHLKDLIQILSQVGIQQQDFLTISQVKLQPTVPGGNVGRGKNLTPTKRKLIDSKKVATLMPVFGQNHTHEFSPVESDSNLQSQAKRPRMETGVKHLASQPPTYQ